MNSNPDQEEIFNRIYGAHHRALHSFLFGKTGDSHVALDLLQETFMRAWRNLQVVQKLSTESQGYWLLRVARNLTTDHFRKCGKQSMLHEELMLTAQENKTAPGNDAYAITANKEDLGFIEGAIQQLPEELRTIFTMSVLGGLSSAEVADRLEMPAGTVRYQLLMARRMLAQKLQSFQKSSIRSSHADKSFAN